MYVSRMNLVRLQQPNVAARPVPAPVVRTAYVGAWARPSLRSVDRSRCRVAQGEAEAPVAPPESSPARAKNTGSCALTPEEAARYQVGQVVSGVVQEARHFGAFVELEGGVVGMVSARQVSGGAVKAADQVLRDGDSIKAVVVRVEPEKGRIALSTKYLEPTPGDMLTHPQLVYDKAEETVAGRDLATTIAQEMEQIKAKQEAARAAAKERKAADRPRHPNSRALTPEELQQYQVGQVVSGVVQEAKPFGAFIDIGGGVVGLLPVTEVSQQQVKKIRDVLRDGDSVKAVVITVDYEKGRIAFSTKHLEPTPGDMLRDPQLVYDKAEEMAEQFRKRVQ